MKHTLFTLLLLLLMHDSFSQGATLTKGETIAYLQRKLDETTQFEMRKVEKPEILKGEKLTIIRTFENPVISINENNIVTIQFTEKEKWKYRQDGIDYDQDREDKTVRKSISFNPSAIKSISVGNVHTESDIDLIFITFSYKFPAKYNEISCQSDLLEIPYYNADPQNGSRIEKAFLHLKDLITAEGDPFDN